MINYIKSELYRITRMKGIYILGLIAVGLLSIMNILLFIIGGTDHSFGYSNTMFAFNMAEGSVEMVFILTLCMGAIIFAEEYKNRTLMNSIASGYSRLQLYFGKIITGIIVSIVTITIVFIVFIGSSYLLLENSGVEYLLNMLRCYAVDSLILICGEVGAITFMFLTNSISAATWAWVGTFIAIPAISGLLGMKFKFFAELCHWLVYSLTGETVMDGENMVAVYMTNTGMQRCLLAGAIGTIVFLLIGVLCMRNKEFK